MKKIKKFFAILVAFMVMFSGFGYAKAASVVNEGNILDDNNEPFFKARDVTYTAEYIWAKLRTSDGDIAYCLDFGKNWPDSGTGVSYKDSIDPADAGLIYIIQHGASDYKNPTNQERYVTQGAIWLYVTNSNTFSREFDDPHGLLARMNTLVREAKQAKASGNVNSGVINEINTPSTYLTKQDGLYVSSVITPAISGVNTYSVSLTSTEGWGCVQGEHCRTGIFPENNNVNDEGVFEASFDAGEGFIVKAPAGLSSNAKITVSVSITTKAHVISPSVNSDYQRVVTLSDTDKRITKSINLTLAPVCVDYKIVGDVIPDPNLTDPTPEKNCFNKGKNYTQERELTSKTGCTFKGWFTEENLTGKWVDGTALENDMTLYGAWDCPEKVTVPPTAASTPLIILGSGLAIVAGGFGYYIFKVKKA